MTKIAKALAYLAANPGATPYAAAKHADMKNPASLYVHLGKVKAKAAGVCRTCGRNIPSVLKTDT